MAAEVSAARISRVAEGRCVRAGHGFTLIEILVAVAIVAILASIAIPSYESAIRKGRRASAQEFLLQVAQRQQQYLSDRRAYAPDLAGLGLGIPAEVARHYQLEMQISRGPPAAFVITARPRGTSPQMADGPISIDQSGRRTPADRW